MGWNSLRNYIISSFSILTSCSLTLSLSVLENHTHTLCIELFDNLKIPDTGWEHPPVLHSPPLWCSAPPAPLPPVRARFRDTLLWTSGTGALPCENRTSVASFLKAWQLFTRMQSMTKEWHDSYALRCMVLSEGSAASGDEGACMSVFKLTDAGCTAWRFSVSRRFYTLQPVRLSLWQLLRCISVLRLWLVASMRARKITSPMLLFWRAKWVRELFDPDAG